MFILRFVLPMWSKRFAATALPVLLLLAAGSPPAEASDVHLGPVELVPGQFARVRVADVRLAGSGGTPCKVTVTIFDKIGQQVSATVLQPLPGETHAVTASGPNTFRAQVKIPPGTCSSSILASGEIFDSTSFIVVLYLPPIEIP
jgi:hypothetical protein